MMYTGKFWLIKGDNTIITRTPFSLVPNCTGGLDTSWRIPSPGVIIPSVMNSYMLDIGGSIWCKGIRNVDCISVTESCVDMS